MRTISAVALAALVAMPPRAMADFNCLVKVNHVLVYANGYVNVHHTGRNDFTVVCNLNENYGAVSPSTCAMWAAMVQHVKRIGGTADFWFAGPGSCATMGTYGSAPVPTYIGDMKTP